jgi:hypothetical protein
MTVLFIGQEIEGQGQTTWSCTCSLRMNETDLSKAVYGVFTRRS